MRLPSSVLLDEPVIPYEETLAWRMTEARRRQTMVIALKEDGGSESGAGEEEHFGVEG